MKLNHDCVRDLLLEIEEHKVLGEPLTNYNFENNIIFTRYDEQTVFYTMLKLREAGFLECDVQIIEGYVVSFLINDITWLGHEFLDNIRDSKTWKYVKEMAKKSTSMSITYLGKLAAKYINDQFNLI